MPDRPSFDSERGNPVRGKHLTFLVVCAALLALSAFADQTALGYPELTAKVEAEGSVRVIVGVATARGFQPEGLLLDANAVQSQRDAIATAQQSLLDNLSTFDFSVKATFHFVPFVALTVDHAALKFLIASAASGVVTSIEEDVFVPPTLASSIPIVGADDAWARGFVGTGQTVAVLDTGIEKTHSFFGGASSRVVSEACYSTKDLPNGIVPLCPNGQTSQVGSGSADANTAACFSGPGTTGSQLCYHGTHVAGIAAGAGASFSGVAKGANIIAIQVFTRFEGLAGLLCPVSSPCVQTYTSDFIRGLERVYALRSSYNIAASNMSLGGGAYTAPCDAAQTATKAIIDTLRSASIATVVASGNNSYLNALNFPACISTTVSVAASTDGDGVASFSNVASFLDLFAPGVDITSSIPGGSFGSLQGTSMAAPHVAGAWAVLRQASPNSTVDQVLNALANTGVPITDITGITKPRIQIDAALDTLVRTLSITKLGTGSGSVTSNPSGLECGSVCEREFTKGITVQLTASPAADSEFSGWSGHSDCSDGTVTMDAHKTCTATFSLKPLLTVTKAGSGFGTVTSAPAGITCGGDCQQRYATSTVVQLFAAPDAGSSFVGWGGHTDCLNGIVTMNGDRACSATFTLNRTLSVSLAGAGSGSVSSSPAGISCEADCQEIYVEGTVVTLSATPSIGSEFAGWSGGSDCADGVITMSTNWSCTATFDPCSISSEVTVSGVEIAGVETHQACNTLIIGPSVTISGQAVFRAGNEIRFVEPVSVLAGATMDVVIGPPI